MKKMIALVMVLGVLGGVLVGCGAAADNAPAANTPAAEPAK